MRRSQLRAIAAGALLLTGGATAASVEKTAAALPGAAGNASAAPAPKAKVRAGKKVIFDVLKGSTEPTRLPNDARLEARGGVFL